MLGTIQELKLIARCVAFDDRDAFGKLVDNYYAPLDRFLYNLTSNDASLTDDLCQETFLKAWISIRSFKGISKFKTWLFRIAYNEFISYKRKEENNEDLSSAVNHVVDDNHSSTEYSIDLQTAMNSLTEKEKSVVLLFYIEDMPVKKIIEITGLPEGTVKVYLSRAREKMKQVLQSK